MFNGAIASNGAVSIALSILEGHHQFITANTGNTTDAEVQHYVVNNEGILSNNRHFISKTRMQYQPNGDATTEGQSLLVIGYCYAYFATKDPKYLAAAEKYWQAYVDYFYAGDPIPDTPQRWIANWIVNGKEPVLANSPVNATEPIKSGYKSVMVNFTNGLGQVPQGTPTWGEYLDMATFAFVGMLGWEAVNATVYGQNADLSINRSVPGTVYPVDWIIAWTGDKIDSNGNVIGSGFPVGDRGKVKLKNTSVTGSYKFNYATRQPVENGGYLIGRNQVQHNRPLHVPLLGNKLQRSNASDAEEWFLDACYLLWKITGTQKYKKAFDCVLFTLKEFADLEGLTGATKYFEKNTSTAEIFISSISYDYFYPSAAVITKSRNGAGYIQVSSDRSSQYYLEHIDKDVTLTSTSNLSLDIGGVGNPVGSVFAKVVLGVKISGVLNEYVAYLPPLTTLAPTVKTLSPSLFLKSKDAGGNPYLIPDSSYIGVYGATTITISSQTGLLNGDTGVVVDAFFPDDSGGVYVDFSDMVGGGSAINTIIYKSDGEIDIRIIDSNGWYWYWILPSTSGTWQSFTFNPANLILSGYQPINSGNPTPSSAVYTTVANLTIILENSTDTNISFSYYAINTPAPKLAAAGTVVSEFTLKLQADVAFSVQVGDCYFTNPQGGVLPRYTPGMIPFSNVYDETSGKVDSTNGIPYPGYQYPFIWSVDYDTYGSYAQNMIDMLYDAQQYYNTQIGQLGPVAAAYVWDAPGASSFGTPDTFTMYHWGSDTAWSGYQPRAFQSACRALEELTLRGKTIPTKLTTYVNNWINWLYNFVSTHGVSPTDFPPTTAPAPVANDFTGHMTGLWLAGACHAYLAGHTNANLIPLMDFCFKELVQNYVSLGIPNHPMNGGWSPSVSTTNDNSMYFGFWTGEIMRGISLYIICKTKNPAVPLYATS